MGLLDIIKRIWSGGPWIDLVADPGNRPELTVRTYHALRRRGIRARDDLHRAGRVLDELRR